MENREIPSMQTGPGARVAPFITSPQLRATAFITNIASSVSREGPGGYFQLPAGSHQQKQSCGSIVEPGITSKKRDQIPRYISKEAGVHHSGKKNTF